MRRARAVSVTLVLSLAAGAALAQSAPRDLALMGRVLYDSAANPSVRPVVTAALPDDDPLRAAWQRFDRENGAGWRVHIDPRTGVPALATGPGLPWFDPASPPSCAALEALARGFLARHVALFGVPLAQLVFEPTSCAPGNGGDYRVWLTQRVEGVPVTGARFTLDVVQGRLVAFGGSFLAPVRVAVAPQIGARAARDVALAYAGRTAANAPEMSAPELRLVPVDPRGDGGTAWDGARGGGLAHRLAWHVTLRTPEDGMTWSADVDAIDGTVAAFRLDTQFGYVVGDVYPLTNDGLDWEGTRQPRFPMPFMDVKQNGSVVGTSGRGGFAPCSTWGVTTEFGFAGPFWRLINFCGVPYETSMCPADMDLSGNDGTDCLFPAGHNVGDDNATRGIFYHLNRVAEKGRWYFPDQDWYSTQQVAWVNQLTMACNGYIDGDGLHYGVSADTCRNFGENEAVVVHEWGHGVGYHDGAPVQDSPSEAEPDSAALLETRLSCIGRGGYYGTCSACGDACLTCTGVREHDWMHLASQTPWTWQNLCSPGSGPCGKSDYEEGAVLNQALYDLATRDLFAHGMDLDSAWQLAERLWYQSRRNSSGNAYNCTWGVGTDGCGVDAWFHKFLVADDDDGNLKNGTPHAAAIFGAFSRHGIACGSSSDPQNQDHTSCPAIGTPEITVITKPGGSWVHWAAVPNATGYRVLSTDLGCPRAQTVVSAQASPDWTDAELTPNIPRYYRVQATGAGKCESAVSNCAHAERDGDNDGWSSQQDCDDQDATVYPHATELCDGKDNDCDATTDEGLPQQTFWWDGDLDSHGVASPTMSACARPYHYASNHDDCDDADWYTHPGAAERCDAEDNDCNGALPGNESDRDFDGWVECTGYAGDRPGIHGGGDCDDLDDFTYPTAPELCDGTDNDCNGAVPQNESDADADGWVPCSPWDDYHQAFPYILGGGDCDDANAARHPGATEACNALDDDCDGTVDEGAPGPGMAKGLALVHDTLSWPAQPAALTYDVMKGDLSMLVQNGGDYTPTVWGCVADDLAATTVVDTDRPRPAKALYYIYRSNGCGQPGTYDEGGGQQDSRDREIGGSTHACP